MNISHSVPSAPRAVPVSAHLAATGRAVWRFLEACGRSRASAEMLRVADGLQSTHPAAAARLRSAARQNRA